MTIRQRAWMSARVGWSRVSLIRARALLAKCSAAAVAPFWPPYRRIMAGELLKKRRFCVSAICHVLDTCGGRESRVRWAKTSGRPGSHQLRARQAESTVSRGSAVLGSTRVMPTSLWKSDEATFGGKRGNKNESESEGNSYLDAQHKSA